MDAEKDYKDLSSDGEIKNHHESKEHLQNQIEETDAKDNIKMENDNDNDETNKIGNSDNYAQRCKNNNNKSPSSDITFPKSDDVELLSNSSDQETNEKESIPLNNDLNNELEISKESVENTASKTVADNESTSDEFKETSLPSTIKINGDHVISRNQSVEDIKNCGKNDSVDGSKESLEIRAVSPSQSVGDLEICLENKIMSPNRSVEDVAESLENERIPANQSAEEVEECLENKMISPRQSAEEFQECAENKTFSPNQSADDVEDHKHDQVISEENQTMENIVDCEENESQIKEETEISLENKEVVSTSKEDPSPDDNNVFIESNAKREEIDTSVHYNLFDKDNINNIYDSVVILPEIEPKEQNKIITEKFKVCEKEIEENSRDSSSNSIRSISSIKSSSPQHLVIDQPLEEEKIPPPPPAAPPQINTKRKTNRRRIKKDSHTIKKKTTKTTAESRKKQQTNLSKDKNCTQSNMTTSQMLEEPENSENSTMKSIATTAPETEKETEIEKQQLKILENQQQQRQCECKLSHKDNGGNGLTNIFDGVHQENCSFYKQPLASYYYKCSSCETYHEKWSLFLHIYEYHDRFLCLYCIKCFPTAEKLSLHLEIKHDLEQNHFNSEEAFRSSAILCNGYSLETRFLMCCTCQHIFREGAAFTEHLCAEYMKSCKLCGQKGRHTNQCKAHPFAKRRNKKKVKEKSKKSIETPPAPVIKETIAPTAPPPIEQPEIVKPPILHSEDSNSSSNMVIDESCNMVAHSMVANINPFKALDESERLEMQLENTTTTTETSLLPPPLSLENKENYENVNENANGNSSILKFKLRVPKEFQKPVDEMISSSESDDGSSYEDVNVEEVENKSERNNEENDDMLKKLQMDSMEQNPDSNESLNINEKDNSKGSGGGYNVDDESMDDEEQNLHLARILQEIEQTKLDIIRTKETIHNSHNSQKPEIAPDTPLNENENDNDNENEENENENEENENENENKNVSDILPHAEMENSEKNWTPTPPASPNTSQSLGISNQAENIPSAEEEEEEDLQDSVHDSSMDTDEINKDLTGNSDSELIPETGNEIPDVMDDQENNNESIAQTSNNENDSQLEANAMLTMDTETEMEIENKNENEKENVVSTEAVILPPSDGIEVANDDFLVVDLQLERPLHTYEIVEFVRICLKSAYPFCLYCNHARRIAVSAESLVLHLLSQHRFSATVDSITAEELQPETIVTKLKSFLPDLKDEYLNSNSYCTMGDGNFTRHFNERIFECFQCRFVTSTHKELYLHNRKMHLRTAILCFMCRCNFFSFSEILCHICPGVPHKVSIFEIKFRCCLCNIDNIPSPFRLMVHLRKRHFACDICLEDCRDQSKLSSHVWKHKLHHLCYRCGIAYRNKQDITKHLFWKHGTESAICKRCLNKRWPHVYHFCVPPPTFVCDVCQLCFSKAVYLTVHKRLHAEDFRYPCTEENCEAKFISRKLLLKHAQQHQIEDTCIGKDLHNEKTNEDSEAQNDETHRMETNEFDEERKECEDVKDGIPKIEDNESELESKCENLTEEQPKPLPSMDLEAPIEKPQKKKKKKRNKESLEDLNLTVPNLSESGSSSESESESKSTKCEDDVPQVMLSPPSENEENDIKEPKLSETDDTDNPEKVLDIWKNFLQAQQGSVGGEIVESPQFADYTEDDYPTPKNLHVCYSDHDYCNMFRPPTPVSETKDLPNETIPGNKSQRNSQSPQRPSSRNSNNSSSSSDASSDESSSSNCTCGTKCSCSSSSSNSSSSDNSDSSSASRKQRKKLIRSGRHRKSESLSPLKSRSVSEMVNVIDTDENNLEIKKTLENTDPPSEPTINESDLETAESESDEEYYDEHPQKLANELLSKKRAQLMARTLLSPSHNYDIVENSRPSTPSLPEDVVYEKRKKKKKRERKYSGRKYNEQSVGENTEISPNTNQNSSILPQQILTTNHHQTQDQTLSHEGGEQHSNFQYSGTTLYETAEPSLYTAGTGGFQASTFAQSSSIQNTSAVYTPRISEGSSCSDVDGSLKRSKRTRRPNKFYGYTSDDESMGSSGFGQSLVIGMRAFKPQPPPQLVWNKEDLPTPSKSILNNNKKTPRGTKRQEDFNLTNVQLEEEGGDHDQLMGPLPKKRRIAPSSLQNSNRKRSAKSLSNRQHLPPIPRLKIRPSLFASNSFNNDHNNQVKNSNLDDYGSSDASSEDDDQPDDDGESMWNKTPISSETYAERERIQTPISTSVPHLTPQQQLQQHQQQQPPSLPRVLPPTPQTTVFNHKIPPALLPNPDFATLQYFKANNIRYPIRPPAGARAARDGESVYCYCRCPYDEVSEMIACDGDSCLIEWFHFECVGIMVAPQGKWFCAECRPHYSEDLYPTTTTSASGIMANVREHH